MQRAGRFTSLGLRYDRGDCRRLIAPPLPASVVLAVGDCGLYTGPWGVRVEDTLLVGEDGPDVLTDLRRDLTR